MRNVVFMLLFTAALVGAQAPMITVPLPILRWYIHVVNGLSEDGLLVHCQSKDDDLGYHHLLQRGDDYQWNFKMNLWKTTLFWCNLEKPDAYVSFESFWPERRHSWLRDRCRDGDHGNCIWTAKNDGIYLRNIPAKVDELIHNWISKT